MTGVLQTLIGGFGAAAAAVTDAYFYLVTLLLPGNGTNGAQNNTFLDSSSNNFTITRNGNTTQGTFSPFSQTGWSNYFDGAGDNLALPTVTAVGNSNVTIEFFIYPTDSSLTYRTVFDTRSAGGGDTGFAFFQYGLTIEVWGLNLKVSSAAAALTINQWNHVALTRSSGTCQLYINGSSSGSSGSYSANLTSTISRIGDNAGIAFPYLGYISNLRVVIGSVLYSGSTYTVPTAPLTAITNTSLLTCQSNRFVDSSANAFAITVNGNPSVQAFEPFAPGVAYSVATVGGSGYFDGSDSLTLASNTNLALGSGDFEVSFWLYPTTTTQRNMIWSATGSPAIFMNSSRQLTFDNYGVASIATSTNTMDLNAWNHCVASRVSGTLKLFINGAEGASVSNSTNWGSATLNLGFDSGVTYMTGYMSGIRVVKGSGVTSVTVPTAPPTAITNTQLLLNFTNAGITDATAKNDLETVGNAQISTVQSRWGGGSMYFDGTGDWLTFVSNPNVQFGSGDFTVEAWVYLPSLANTYYVIAGQRTGDTVANIGWTMYINASKASFDFSNGSSSFTATNNTTLAVNTWYHIAAVKSGTSLTVYVNGTGGTAVTVSGSVVVAGTLVYVGAVTGSVLTAFNGYIDDLRITKGYARYTSNFTAPTAAFALQ